MWTLLGFVISFTILIALVSKGKNFGLSMLLAAIILAIFSQQNLTFQQTILVFKQAITSIDTIALTIGVTLIGILANVMKETGEIEGIIEDLRTRLPHGGILVSAPAVFGLLPVPGGALMSAPLVDEEGEKLNVTKPIRGFLNLWYRHVGFLIFPLAPPLLLLAREANIAIHWLIIIQTPLFLLAFLIGVFYLKRGTKNPNRNKKKINKTPSSRSLLTNLSPIIVSVVLFFLFSYLTPLSFYLSLVTSVSAGIITSFLAKKKLEKKWTKIINEGISFDLAIAVFGILIFYQVVQSSGLSQTLASVLSGYFLPLPIVVLLLSYFLGFSMGHNLGAVGVSYSILGTAISGNLPMVSLIYIASFYGYLISPIHLCVAVSYEYFNLDILKFYKTYLPPSILALTLSAIILTII